VLRLGRGEGTWVRSSSMNDRTDFVAADVPIHPAATVMLIRDVVDEPSGIEVFMLRRTARAAFGAGMFVFPGGRVDAADGSAGTEAYCRGLDDVEASSRLGVGSGGLAYWIAAVRESFEEAGVIMAERMDGAPVEVDPGERHLVHDGELSILDLCVRRKLVVDLDRLHYVDHWVTPLGEKRRFDTRFFLAEVPPDQELVHDDSETIDSLWVRPSVAIEMFDDGRLTMMPPTIFNLHRLAQYSCVADAVAVAAAIIDPPRIEPRLRYDDNGRVIGVALPWDDDFVLPVD
jgi:8-oxo-dGTP pyrophosphatase MutT (NUDIX family)